MKKFSKKLIYHGIISGLLFSALVLFYCIIGFQPEDDFIIDPTIITIEAIAAGVFFIIYMIYKVLFYNLSGYELKETQIICQRGVLFKKKSILDYSKINSVNKRQGLIQKLFGISYLMVDSGSTSRAHQAEIMIIEDANVVNDLYNKLKAIDKENPVLQVNNAKANIEDNNTNEVVLNKVEEENLYRFNSKSKFIYSLVNSIGLLIGALFIVGVLFGILLLCFYFPDEDTEVLTWVEIIVVTISAYAIINVMGLLANIVKAFIGYYNYKITKVNDTINVEYGLFVNTQNSFNLSKVKGVVITQGIFQRIFKLATIKVEVIGYIETTNNNNNAVIGILIPLCKLSEVNTYLEKIIPSHIPVKQENKAKAFPPFILWNTLIALITTVLCLIPAACISLAFDSTLGLILSSLVAAGAFLIYEIFLLIGAAFAYYAQDITYDDENITVHNGALVKHSTVIKKSNIIAIEDVTTSSRAKKGIYSYVIHFHTNAFSNTKKVHIVDEKLRDILLGFMKY